jgi:hypothetical protein
MRPLLIDDEARAKAKKVVDYAKLHPYYLPAAGQVPGGNPNFVAKLNTYRCVFTFTHSRGEVWRHLSISVPGENYPNPFAAWTIAELFGFTGWDGSSIGAPFGWIFNVNPKEHCIVIAQKEQ